MNFAALAIAGILFVFGWYVGRASIPQNRDTLRPTPTVTQMPSPSPTPREKLDNSDGTPSPSVQGTSATNTPSPKQQIQNSQGNLLSDWVYPASLKTSVTDSSLSLESQDNATKVTDWYTAQFDAKGIKNKSIAKTNSNGTVQNSLSGILGGEQITISVSGKPNSVTKIVITDNKAKNGNIHIEINNSTIDNNNSSL